MSKQTATKNPVLRSIIRSINEQKCLLFLGPDLLNNDGNNMSDSIDVYAHLANILPNKVNHYKEKGLLGFNDKGGERDLIMEDLIQDFFDDQEPNDVYKNIAELPFRLIINTSPDKTINKAFAEKGIGFDYGFYHKDRGTPKPIKQKNVTLIYNIFGDYTDVDSMVLTHIDLFDYLESFMRLNDFFIKDEIKKATMILFLGFSFDKWYFQLLLWLMTYESKAYRGSHSITKENIKQICEKEFNVEFFNDGAKGLLEELCQAKSDGKIEEQSFDYKPELFISYKHGGQSEEIADKLENTLPVNGLKVLRDKKDLKYKDDLMAFMDRIGETDGGIVIISRDYLESINCMRELMKLYEKDDFIDNIYPICLDDANFYDKEEILKYRSYWEVKKDKMLKLYDENPDSADDLFSDDMKLIENIISDFTKVAKILQDHILASPKEHLESDFKAIIAEIKEKI